MRIFAVAVVLLAPSYLAGAQHSGTVRAADQFIPGATVTARNGAAKVVAYTDENGRYSLELAPGAWDLQIEMFGFNTLKGQITVATEPVHRDWTLEMPRLKSSAQPADILPNVPAARTGRGGGRFGGRFPNAGGRGGRNPQQARAGTGGAGRSTSADGAQASRTCPSRRPKMDGRRWRTPSKRLLPISEPWTKATPTW